MPLTAPSELSAGSYAADRSRYHPEASSALAGRKVWLNIHIPKCGGTTFIDILRRSFREGFRDGRGLLDNYQYSRVQVEQLLSFNPVVTCLSDHKLSADLPYEMDGVELRAIALIRNPVDRFLSQYFFNRNHADYCPEAKRLDLDDFITWSLDRRNQPQYVSGQTGFLAGSGGEAGLARISDLVQRGWLLLFPLERFTDVCITLEYAFPRTFTDCIYDLKNVSEKDQVITDVQRERIARKSQWDIELVRGAESHLDGLMGQVIGDSVAIERARSSFRSRLEARRRTANSFSVKVHSRLRGMAKRIIQ